MLSFQVMVCNCKFGLISPIVQHKNRTAYLLHLTTPTYCLSPGDFIDLILTYFNLNISNMENTRQNLTVKITSYFS